MSASSHLLRRTLVHVLIVVGALLASSAALAPSADAMSPGTRSHVLHIAASKRGTPYRYGATGPSAFDCSGFTRWVFAKVGRRIPRTAASQSAFAHHVRASARRTGDLVFFHSGRHVYHVGIYAGGNTIWHAPHTGSWVHRERIWTRAVWYGRIG
jgi:cell wall-associated NlpC family hydrolase